MFRLKINTNKVTNDRDLPKTPEPGLLFYEMVIFQQGDTSPRPLIRASFKEGDPDLELELYRHDVEVPEISIKKSMAGTVARYDCLPLGVHFYKVIEDPDLDGLIYKRHVSEGNSEMQDVPAFIIDGTAPNPEHIPEYITEICFDPSLPPLKPMDEVPVTTHRGERRMWLTQKRFYSTSNVTMSNVVHKENLTRAVRFLKRGGGGPTLLSVLIDFGNALVQGRIKYKHDTMFANVGIAGDAGDALIELTATGDCEDFGHFYMRMFRMLGSIYKFVIPDTDDLYYKCQTLEKQYIPYNMICKVLVRGRKDFHSTLMLVPRTNENPVISFEVTNPDKSYTLPDRAYNRWHLEHYFLLDHIGIHRLNREKGEHKSGPIDQLTVDKMLFFNY